MPTYETIPVADLGNPALEPYRDQKDAWLRVQRQGGTGLGGLFMAEGEIVVRELLASRHRVRSVLITPGRLERMAPALDALPAGTPVFVAQRALAERIVGFDMHRGVLALGEQAPQPSVADLAHRCEAVLVLEGLSNHDNVGSLYRSLSALGPDRSGVVLCPRTADPLYRKALRVSMGHALRLETARASAWPEDLASLSRAGLAVVALTPDPDATAIARLGRPGRVALVVGAEGDGLSPQAIRAADARVRVPMRPGVDSLNVAVAAAIALHRLCAPGTGSGTFRAPERL